MRKKLAVYENSLHQVIHESLQRYVVGENRLGRCCTGTAVGPCRVRC